MDGQTLLIALTAAVLVFWTVGAYNRLVGLRNELLRCFAPVDEQFRARHALRLAEDILARARERLTAGADEALAADLAEADTTLAFARRQFNEAAHAYNRAVSQFPTWVLAGLFGFRKAGTL
jgi:LemA protein